MKENMLVTKSLSFAVQIVKLCDSYYAKQQYVLSKQLLKSGTSIGANIAEAQGAQTDADFYTKLKIAEKEARETLYWLELLYRSVKLAKEQYEILSAECNELTSLLVASCKTVSARINRSS